MLAVEERCVPDVPEKGTRKAGPCPTKKQGSARLFCVFGTRGFPSGVASLLGKLAFARQITERETRMTEGDVIVSLQRETKTGHEKGGRLSNQETGVRQWFCVSGNAGRCRLPLRWIFPPGVASLLGELVCTSSTDYVTARHGRQALHCSSARLRSHTDVYRCVENGARKRRASVQPRNRRPPVVLRFRERRAMSIALAVDFPSGGRFAPR